MSHFLDLFSPETAAKFASSDRTVSGFRVRHRKATQRVQRGDIFICYLTKLSRWIGLLEVTGAVYEDATPRFAEDADPFVLRFAVNPIVWLSPHDGIPIHEKALWETLSFTRKHEQGSSTWTGAVRSSLVRLQNDDALLLDRMLRDQASKPKSYPLEADEVRALQHHIVRRSDKAIRVTIPEEEVDKPTTPQPTEARDSIQIQALLARIGARMGFRIWLPASDRSLVTKEAPDVAEALVKELPLNYDNTTLRTIENIDVLWLKGRAMARAFEIEHTTAIYSGILRMADLLALQPNMDIRLHIAAPEERKQKVFDEIQRPVFSLLEGKPLAERCTFLSYDDIRELANAEHLAYLSDAVLEQYEEVASP